MRLVVFPSRDGWRVRTQWSNGLVFATTEAYYSKSNALRAAWRAAAGFKGRVEVWIDPPKVRR